MFENPRRVRQARNFTKTVPKILDLKSSSEQMFSEKLTLGAPVLSVTEIAPKSPLLCVNRSPTRYGFRACANSMRYSVNQERIISWCEHSLIFHYWFVFGFGNLWQLKFESVEYGLRSRCGVFRGREKFRWTNWRLQRRIKETFYTKNTRFANYVKPNSNIFYSTSSYLARFRRHSATCLKDSNFHDNIDCSVSSFTSFLKLTVCIF